MKLDIKVNYHSSICINGEIFVDPLGIGKRVKGVKLIFITHSHWDHLDIKSIMNLINVNTIIVCTTDAAQQFLDAGFAASNIMVVEPFQSFELLGIYCETFPSYNIEKPYHPRANNWVGYNLTIDGVKYTICGDSDITEELKELVTDVLFVPIGGKYTMDAVDGARLTNKIKPKLVVPVHYGKIVGDDEYDKVFLEHLNHDINYKIFI